MLAFLADMPVPQSTVRLARRLGHDAVHVREYGMQRATDPEILERAGIEGRIILTMDLDFPREVALTGVHCTGLIIFRLGNVSAVTITKTLERVLKTLPEKYIVGHILIVEPDRVRRRALPTGR